MKKKMRDYSENAYRESIASLTRLTGDIACTKAIDDMLTKLDNDVITKTFIRENGKLVTDFCWFFKGIEKVPKKYWHPLFEHYEESIARFAYYRTKDAALSLVTGEYEHDTVYLSLVSHLDCASHSIVNHLKRNLGIFKRYNKLSKK